MTPIAIVGGGIAGLALAAACARRDLPCAVFEQAAGPAETGAGVQIAPNAARLLHRLGLAGRLREVATRPVATEFRRWDDDLLIGRSALGEQCTRRYGAPYYTIHRADLRDALASLVPGLVQPGRRVAAVRPAAGGAMLRFTDGTIWPAALVAGADGIRSVVRRALAADKPVFSGLGTFRGLVPTDAVPEFAAEPAVRVWLGPGRHLVSYPVSAGRAISFAATLACDMPGEESWSRQGSAAELSRAFDGWNPVVRRLLAAAGTVRHWALYDREPLRCLGTAEVALIGDAAHPMLPFAAQGANQAIEDAVALAACLAGTGAGRGGTRRARAEAVHRYQACRAPRTARLQRQARADIGALHLPDGPAQRCRDEALRTGTGPDRQSWLYGYDVEQECA